MSRTREGLLWQRDGIREGLRTDATTGAAASKPHREQYDAIVIGAGFAGLTAARDLAASGDLSVLLIEARDRIGGRTWTAKELGEEFEMGGTWVHWNQPYVYSELQKYGLHKNLKISIGNFGPEKHYFTPDGASAPVEIAAAEAERILDSVSTKLFNIDGHTARSLMPFPHDPFRDTTWVKYDGWSLKDRLNQLKDVPSVEKAFLEANVNSLGSAPASETSFTEYLRWYALSGYRFGAMLDCVGVFKIGQGGMTSLAKAILKDYRGDYLSCTAVSKISQPAPNGNVTLHLCNQTQVSAQSVVCTIPLNCLSDIEFSPPLSPLKCEAVATGQLNMGSKIHVKTASPTGSWFSTCSSRDDSSSPYVFGFTDHFGSKSTGPHRSYCVLFGYNGRVKDPRDSSFIVDGFRRHVYDTEVAAYLTHDWVSDPYAKGSWSCWGPRSMSRYLQELQRPHGNVVFASADWADGWRGFVDGAVERGQQAARSIHEDRQTRKTTSNL